MPKFASKNIPYAVKKSLLRKKPREIREYDKDDASSVRHKELLDSFTREDFMNYETWLHRWGTPGRKRHIMLQEMDKKGVSECLRKLAIIRENDLLEHRRIIQCLRHRWLDLSEHRKEVVNNNPDKFWAGMAVKLARSQKERKKIAVSKTWEGDENRLELIKFLKTLYEKQNGKCAITGVPLELEIGTNKPNPNKCSLDRIDSSRGYNHRNVWFVAWWVNAMKSDMDMKTFLNRVRLIHESQKLDNNSK